MREVGYVEAARQPAVVIRGDPILGPAPCHECHARLYYLSLPTSRWVERRWMGTGWGYAVHNCTARASLNVNFARTRG